MEAIHLSKYDISNSGNGYDSDGTRLNLFIMEDLERLFEDISETFDSLVENFKEDSTEPNPFIMGAATFIQEFYPTSSYKEDVREFFEEIQAQRNMEGK
jgi:hypothetical protein